MPAYIQAISTASPNYLHQQADIADFMMSYGAMDDRQKQQLRLLYRASSIRSRYSVLPDFTLGNNPMLFHQNQLQPSTAERMTLYEQQAPLLAQKAVKDVLAKTNTSPEAVTHLITVSCTGMYAPGLDIDLIMQCQLPSHTQRIQVNFMGCYGSFPALKMARDICTADPKAVVLLVAVELCTLHFNPGGSEDQSLANALFADGAAAALVTSTPGSMSALKINKERSAIAPHTRGDMSWRIGNQGFVMTLSGDVPDRIKAWIQAEIHALLSDIRLTIADFQWLAVHPGGKKILTAVEDALNVARHLNGHAHDVLREYGNMSSVTILFILDRLLQTAKNEDNVLAMAFGPGLVLEALHLTAIQHA